VRAVNEALTELPGVTVERVEIGKASVALDDARVAPAQVIDAVQDAGYAAHVVA
jgi:copper chaperone CopZ